MARDIQIKKTVYKKVTFDKVIDRSFKQFVPIVDEISDVTIEEFFSYYDALFYEIAPNGDNLSHEYLIRKSSEIVNLEKDSTDIQPLLDEITTLREQILSYQEQLIEANTPDL